MYATTDRIKSFRRHRNEPDDFDPGSGPEVFEIAGLRASCMLCADAFANRCLKLLRQLNPEIVFYPNNREMWHPKEYWAEIAQAINAPLLITNRVGISWGEQCDGGCSVYSKTGELLASANTDGKEEILLFDLSKLGLCSV